MILPHFVQFDNAGTNAYSAGAPFVVSVTALTICLQFFTIPDRIIDSFGRSLTDTLLVDLTSPGDSVCQATNASFQLSGTLVSSVHLFLHRPITFVPIITGTCSTYSVKGTTNAQTSITLSGKNGTLT